MSDLAKMKELRAKLRRDIENVEQVAREAGRDLTKDEKRVIASSDAMVDALSAKITLAEGKASKSRAKGRAETPTEHNAVLRGEHRYSDWLQANWYRENVSDPIPRITR